MTSPTTNRHANYLTKGILRGEAINWSRSTLAVRAVCTVHRVDKFVSEGYKNQSLIDKLFSKQLETERLLKLFNFRPNERIQLALDNPLLLAV